ncbi:MAG: hypothetical protein ABSE62_11625 [Chthoniobacteraceae bacterium]|jgi:hypothetical protein
MSRFHSFLLLVVGVVLAAGRLCAQDTYVFTSYDFNLDPPFITLFASETEVKQDTVLAFRFKAQVSGIIDFVQVELYSPSALNNSCIVSLNYDASGKLGPQMTYWNFDGVDTAGFLGSMLYNQNSGAVVHKGQYYWVEVQPLNVNSDVYWALSYNDAGTPLGTEYQTGHSGFDEYISNVTPNAMTIEIQTPAVPTSASPSNYLLEGEPIEGGTLSSLGDNAQTPFLGTFTTPTIKARPVIYDDLTDILLIPGGIGGYILKSFDQEPSGYSTVGTLATGGGITKATSSVLITGLSLFGADNRIAAQSGVPLTGLPAGVTIKSFNAIDGNGATTFFLATLQGTGISGKNSAALLATTSTGVNLLVQKGEPALGKFVKDITTLASSKLTPASSRWRVDDQTIGVDLTFTDKSSALFSIPATAASPSDWTRYAGTGDILDTGTGSVINGTKILSFGLPGFGPEGVAASALLQSASTSSPKELALLQLTSTSTTLIALQGDNAPDVTGSAGIAGTNFVSFGDPICSSTGRLAFPAVTTGADSKGLWWVDTDGVLRLIARQGGVAAGGGNYTSFGSLDFPVNGDGPLFTATLDTDPASYVFPGTNGGLWTINQSSGLRLLVRQGGNIYIDYNPYKVDSFTALTGATGSPGTQSNFETPGTVDVIVDTKSGIKSQRYLLEIPY